MAKSHVDFLGSYLQKLHKQTHKGVHAKITKIEGVKAVLHTYLVVADLLGYLDTKKSSTSGKFDIQTASLDEIESVLGVSRNNAKEIIKLRVNHGKITLNLLSSLKGIGAKTLNKMKEFIA